MGCRRRGVSRQILKAELEFRCFSEFALKAASLISFFFSHDSLSSRGHFYINFSPFECRYVDKTSEDVNFKCSTYPNRINNTWIGLPYGKWVFFSPSYIEVNRMQKNLLFLITPVLHIKNNGDKQSWSQVGLLFCSPFLSQGYCVTLSW